LDAYQSADDEFDCKAGRGETPTQVSKYSGPSTSRDALPLQPPWYRTPSWPITTATVQDTVLAHHRESHPVIIHGIYRSRSALETFTADERILGSLADVNDNKLELKGASDPLDPLDNDKTK